MKFFKTHPDHPEPDRDQDGTGRDRDSRPFFFGLKLDFLGVGLGLPVRLEDERFGMRKAVRDEEDSGGLGSQW